MGFCVTVQPKKDKSIIHELARCIIGLFFGLNCYYLLGIVIKK